MKKEEFVSEVADKVGLSLRQTDMVLNAMKDVLQAEIKATGEASLPGIGKFRTVKVKERKYRNTVTGGKEIVKPAHDEIRFRISSKF